MDLPPAPYPAPLRAHLLGPVRLAVGDRVIPDHAWPRRSARALLLLLLATPGHRLPRDRVLDLLWPDATQQAALRALRVALHALRRVLEPGLRAGRESAYVQSRGDAIALRPNVELWLTSTSSSRRWPRWRQRRPPIAQPCSMKRWLSSAVTCLRMSRTRTGRWPVASAYGGSGAAPCWTSLNLSFGGTRLSQSPHSSGC